MLERIQKSIKRFLGKKSLWVLRKYVYEYNIMCTQCYLWHKLTHLKRILNLIRGYLGNPSLLAQILFLSHLRHVIGADTLFAVYLTRTKALYLRSISRGPILDS